jgi:hypothetical protein
MVEGFAVGLAEGLTAFGTCVGWRVRRAVGLEVVVGFSDGKGVGLPAPV